MALPSEMNADIVHQLHFAISSSSLSTEKNDHTGLERAMTMTDQNNFTMKPAGNNN